MLNSDLNSIIGLQNNNPEIYNKEYFIVERNTDGVIKNVHGYCKTFGFELIHVADGRIFLKGKSSHLNHVVELGMGSEPDVVIDLLSSIMDVNAQQFNVVEITTFELLDLTKTY